MTLLNLTLGHREASVEVQTAIIAGWTGRDRHAVEHHIAELEALGVQRPSSLPVFYRVSTSRLTTAAEIEASVTSSGEVEPVLLRYGGELWVGVGSDHTDRDVETYSVAASKQLCDKPLAPKLWRYEEVAPHWDRLILRSWIVESGADVLYQEGTLDGLLDPGALQAQAEPPLADGTAMFCGTLAAKGGIRSSTAFRYELEDPVLARVIVGRYAVRMLPVIA
jgi:hypothetical protein